MNEEKELIGLTDGQVRSFAKSFATKIGCIERLGGVEAEGVKIDTIEGLKEEIKELKEQNKKLLEEKEGGIDDYNDLVDENNKTVDDYNDLKEENDELQKGYNHLEETVAFLKIKNANLKDDIDELEVRLEMKDEDTYDCEECEEKLAELKEKDVLIGKLAKLLTEKEEKLAELEDKTLVLLDCIEECEDNIDVLSLLIEIKDKDIDKLEGYLDGIDEVAWD